MLVVCEARITKTRLINLGGIFKGIFDKERSLMRTQSTNACQEFHRAADLFEPIIFCICHKRIVRTTSHVPVPIDSSVLIIKKPSNNKLRRSFVEIVIFV